MLAGVTGAPRRRAIPVYVALLAVLCLILVVSQAPSARRPPQPFAGASVVSLELSLLRSQVERLQETLLSTHNATLGALDALASLPAGTLVALPSSAAGPPAPDVTPLGVVVALPGAGRTAVLPLQLEPSAAILDVSQHAVHRLSWPPGPGLPPVALRSAVAAGDYVYATQPATGTPQVALVVRVLARRTEWEVRWTRRGGGPPTLLATAPLPVQFTAVDGVRLGLPAGPDAAPADAAASPPAPHGMVAGPARFLLFSFADGPLQELQNITWATVERYAARHGYSHRHLVPEARPKVPIHFHKYTEMVRLFDLGYEWVVWLDADIAITNPNVTLESVIQKYTQPSTSLIIARDPWSDRTTLANMWCPVNSGVFFMRASAWSRHVLELITTLATMKGERFIAFPRRRRFDPGGLVDQPVLTQLLAMEGQVNLAPSQFDIFYRTEHHKHVAIVPQRAFNSALRVGAGYNDHPETVWRPGDWVVHVTGEKNQTKRIRLLRHALSRAREPPAVIPAIGDTIPIPPAVAVAVRGFAGQLRASTVSLRQAELVGAAIHARAARGGAKVLVWSGASVGAYATLWRALNPGGLTAYFVDPDAAAAAAGNGSTPPGFPGPVHHLANPIPLTNDRGDKDLALALQQPCSQVCIAARTRLTLLPPPALRHPWDVILIDDPLLLGPTNQMVYTASLLAFTSPQHTTDIILLNAEHRMLRRYSDAFLGTRSLYNTYACPTPEDVDCPGSYLMHWRVATGAVGRPLDAVLRIVEKSWETQRNTIEKLLQLESPSPPSPPTPGANASHGGPNKSHRPPRKVVCINNVCHYVSPNTTLSPLSVWPSHFPPPPPSVPAGSEPPGQPRRSNVTT